MQFLQRETITNIAIDKAINNLALKLQNADDYENINSSISTRNCI